MISVIMPAYNAGKTIRESINSVVSQTVKDWELIVIDDGSSDDTVDVIAELSAADKRIRFYKNEKNMGVSRTRNRAIELAKGEWVAFLDSDDLWEKSKLEKQLALLNDHPDMVVCYTASAFIDNDGDAYEYIMPAVEQLTYPILLRKNLMSCSSVMIRTSVVREIKFPDDKMCEDYYVWLTALRTHKVAYGVNEPLLIYRLCNESRSSNRLKMVKMLFITYRKLGYDPITSGLMVFRYTLYSIRKRSNILHSV